MLPDAFAWQGRSPMQIEVQPNDDPLTLNSNTRMRNWLRELNAQRRAMRDLQG
jgi:hypothetical protein